MKLPRAGSVLAIFLCLACQGKPALPPGPSDPAALLDQYDRFADRVQCEALAAEWRRAVSSPTLPRPYGIALLSLITEDERAVVRGKLVDPDHIRAWEAIGDLAFRIQSDSAPQVAPLISKIREIHASMSGHDRELRSLLTEKNEAAREQLWKKYFPGAREIEPLFVKLLEARERWAAFRYKAPFLAIAAEHRGYSPETSRRLLAQIQKAIKPRPESGLREPWDKEFRTPELMLQLDELLDSERCADRCAFVLRWAGFATPPRGLRVHSNSRSGFSASAAYLIQPPQDIRITIVAGSGIPGHWTTLHEFGHAAQALTAPARGPFVLRRTISGAVSESCAKVAERLAFAPEWLRLQGVPAAVIAPLKEWEAFSELARMRGIVADIEFESVAYRVPQSDSRMRFAEIQASWAAIRHDPESPAWALQRHLAFEPLERNDYLPARCAQAAVYRRLRSLPGGLLGQEASRVLRRDVLESAAGNRYESWFRIAAGAEPNCTAWLEDVAGLSSF